jgi:hypothetical protein
MTTNTTRRACLKAAPAAAIAAVIPTSIAASAANPQWAQVRSTFLNVHQRVERAAEDHNRMELEQSAFDDSRPTREVTYTEEGWTIENEGMKIEAAPKEATFTLTVQSAGHAPQYLKETPEFAAFIAELDAWKANYREQAHLRGWDAIEAEWEAAVDAKVIAWREMVACPVNTISDLAEKARLARMDEWPDEDELNRLLDGIEGDIARIAGRA